MKQARHQASQCSWHRRCSLRVLIKPPVAHKTHPDALWCILWGAVQVQTALKAGLTEPALAAANLSQEPGAAQMRVQPAVHSQGTHPALGAPPQHHSDGSTGHTQQDWPTSKPQGCSAAQSCSPLNSSTHTSADSPSCSWHRNNSYAAPQYSGNAGHCPRIPHKTSQHQSLSSLGHILSALHCLTWLMLGTAARLRAVWVPTAHRATGHRAAHSRRASSRGPALLLVLLGWACCGGPSGMLVAAQTGATPPPPYAAPPPPSTLPGTYPGMCCARTSYA